VSNNGDEQQRTPLLYSKGGVAAPSIKGPTPLKARPGWLFNHRLLPVSKFGP
jgi:hypothetical protein